MTKDEILKAFYQSNIKQLTDECDDLTLLDLIYLLLIKSKTE